MLTRTAGSAPRRLQPPSTEPPYDDEAGTVPATHPRLRPVGTIRTAQESLPLSVRPRQSLTRAAPASRTTPSLVPGPTPSRRGTGLAEPRRWCSRIAQALAEVLYGRRPLHQLSQWVSDDVQFALTRRVAAQRRTVPGPAPSVRTIRVCTVNPQVVEASVVLQVGSRVRALALRLDAAGDQWVCTALELV
ncbi:Rv3235 family protein [Phytoactinopolyspora limicola]|uniref:Rv3235 family protein n=1 Tax=Phytoactinopolyspora limicola TaxID=2715536 RepID=UPI00140C0B63|nr:Rv3235 family protein [Phytoactinopolyspora limicola]